MTKMVSYILGIVVLALGILGYFTQPILGVFEVDVVHSSIYVVLGALLIVMAMYSPRVGAKVVGTITLIVAILGFIPPYTTMLGANTNIASSVLEAIVGVVLLAVGFMGSEEDQPAGGEQPKTGKMQKGTQQTGAGMGNTQGGNQEGQREM